VRRLELRLVELRLRRPFRHAGHTRDHTRNLLVRAVGGDGGDRSGWGEGLPRDYVTGETESAALAAFDQVGPAVLADGRQALTGLERTPALRCALELALLDLEARSRGLALAELLPRGPEPSGRGAVTRSGAVQYSGVLSADDPARFRRTARLLWLGGLRAVKVKVGLDPEEDLERVRVARRVLGRRAALRVDANGAWTPEVAIQLLGEMRGRHGIEAVEEPVAPGDYTGAAAVGQATGLPVVLDESLCGPGDLAAARAAGVPAIANLRLSKLGGLLPTWEIAEAARQAGFGLQLGCQVGETGLLSAAARTFALRCGGDLLYAEGSFDRHLLIRVPTGPDITFGWGGRGRPLRGPGLGVVPKPGLEAVEVTPGGEPRVIEAP
jgi:muconate cycloisomerase